MRSVRTLMRCGVGCGLLVVRTVPGMSIRSRGGGRPGNVRRSPLGPRYRRTTLTPSRSGTMNMLRRFSALGLVLLLLCGVSKEFKEKVRGAETQAALRDRAYSLSPRLSGERVRERGSSSQFARRDGLMRSLQHASVGHGHGFLPRWGQRQETIMSLKSIAQEL